MPTFEIDWYGEGRLEVPFTGHDLLEDPMWNKGTAFTEEERRELGLLGLLPPHVDTIEEQLGRAYEEFQQRPTDLDRHIFLREVQDENETLFYRIVLDHIAEMFPIIYTPIVGLACQRFSHIYERPRGLFISYPEIHEIDRILDNRPFREVDVIVVTDGERILGLGDQGAGGMGIPLGKLSLYTLCGGIHPARTLPILLDAGTDNEERLRDPLYLGWRDRRIRGEQYDEFIEAFIAGVTRKLPNVLLQWEDFGVQNARRLLDRYRDRLCTFNDDIQGTAAVTLGGVLATLKVTGSRLIDQRVVFFGAGSAGTGISDALVRAMVHDGISVAEARSQLWLIDRQGLIHSGLEGLAPFQQVYAQPRDRLAGWQGIGSGPITLLDVARNVAPTILIGTSGQPGVFTEEIVREIARQVERPIIFPLSNPTSKQEANPADLIAWTEGRAIVATGSPCGDVRYQGRTIKIGQCNNAYAFPGIGLGTIAVRARRISNEMFLAAARALSEWSPMLSNPDSSLFPPLDDIRDVSRRVALAVAAEARRSGLADPASSGDLGGLVDSLRWTPRYRRLHRKP
ncbi:MAG: malic enzyme [candidate division NC10 bacterium]|nr:malic enzyme [candidate division NC10 bacterium]